MSYADHAAARRVKGLRGTTQAVFHEIAFRTSDDDGLHECSVKVATLGEALGKADQAIRLAIKELKGVNLIQTTRRQRQNGTRSCFRFKLIMPFPHSVIVPDRAPRKPQPAVISTAQPAVISTALLSGSSLDQGSIGIKKPEATPSKTPGIADVPSSLQEPEPEKSKTKNPPNSASPPLPHELRKLWEDYAPLDGGLPEGATWGMFKTLAAITVYDVKAMMVRALQDWDALVTRTQVKTAPALPSLAFVVAQRSTLYSWHQELEAQAFVAKMKAEAA
jgi:hypothetical protein